MGQIMRLDKFVADMTGGSRSDVKRRIYGGYALVDGVVCKEPNYKLNTELSQVVFDGAQLSYEPFVYLMLHKPAGLISAVDGKGARTVIDLVNETLSRKNLFPVGRLDKDTTGLLLITDDGAFSHQLTSPKKGIPKRYLAQLDIHVGEAEIAQFAHGVMIGDEMCRPATLFVKQVGETGDIVEITLTEGKYHQVKRMVAAIGGNVLKLHRESIGGLFLDETLEVGAFRRLSEAEKQSLFLSVSMKEEIA